MANKDYYAILGVPRSAEEKEIKSAFRKLAKQYHPDTNQGNTAAEQRFKEVNEAYAILGDADKRKLYDKYGDMAFQEGFDPEAYEAYRNAGYGPADFHQAGFEPGEGYREFHYSGDMDDLFSEFFGQRGQNRFSGGRPRMDGSDLHAEISISFEDAAFGCDRMIRLSGSDGKQTSLQVHIPAGIDEGQKVRLKGKGNPGMNGGMAGDLLLEVHLLPHANYERKGTDVYRTVKIPFATAVLGGETIVPTLYGNVSCKVPAGTQSGSKIRLKGKGIVSMKNSAVHGDEYVIIQIAVPKNLSAQQKRKLQEFAAS